jgi:abortive infection bacteriophage resistance protein
MAMQYAKEALTFDDQLALLIRRGLHVPNEGQALEVLKRISYYRLAGYWFRFRIAGTENFEPGSSFEEAVRLYEFDRKLRLLLLDAVERLEVSLRTSVTYCFGHAYGAFGHIDPVNFARPRVPGEHGRWLEAVRDEASRSHELFVGNYKAKYDGFPDLPIWMASELTSFGTLSKMIAGMKNSDQKVVAGTFGVHQTIFVSWIHAISVVRNRCAHHSRLWNWQLRVSPKRIDRAPAWVRADIKHNDRMFFFLLVVKRLLSAAGDQYVRAWRDEVTELLRPILIIDSYRDEMGAPPNWNTDPLWL